MATSTSPLPKEEVKIQTLFSIMNVEVKITRFFFGGFRKLQPGLVSALTESTFSAKNIFMQKKGICVLAVCTVWLP